MLAIITVKPAALYVVPIPSIRTYIQVMGRASRHTWGISSGSGTRRGFVSQSCHNKAPKTQWLKIAEMCCLTILEARSLKSGCWQDKLVSSERESFLVSSSYGSLWAIFGVPCLFHNFNLYFVTTWHSSVALCPHVAISVRGLYLHRMWGPPYSS